MSPSRLLLWLIVGTTIPTIIVVNLQLTLIMVCSLTVVQSAELLSHDSLCEEEVSCGLHKLRFMVKDITWSID